MLKPILFVDVNKLLTRLALPEFDTEYLGTYVLYNMHDLALLATLCIHCVRKLS